MTCPLQIHYGAKDPLVPPTETTPVTSAAGERANIAVRFHASAGHSFFNKVRPTYDPQASQAAAETVERLLAEVGGAPGYQRR